MFSARTLHRLVILLTVRVLILSSLHANSDEPMMYKLRRGSELEIRHLIVLRPCETMTELKSHIVEVLKKTSYPIEKDDFMKVDLYYQSVFDPKFRLARMTRSELHNKAKIQLFMHTLQQCLNQMKGLDKLHMARQKKRAS